MNPLLILLLLPCTGAILLALLPAHMTRLLRWTGVSIATATMAQALWLLTLFDPSKSGLQLLLKTPFRPQGSFFSLAIDGLSLPMVVLTALLCLISLLASASIRERVKGYYALILLLESATLGVFMAQDWSIFYIFWELTIIPLYFLINTYGGKQRSHSALNFALYTMGGSVFMLISLLIGFDSTAPHSFFMSDMAQGLQQLPNEKQILIFLGFLIGFGVKMPIFPLHGWLPLAHVEAPSPVSILLSGVLLKMGAYGLIRTAIMMPTAMIALQGTLTVLAGINLIYGGVLAWRQSDIKGMIAYSSISHMGVVLLGIATLNHAGITGAILQMVSHGVTAAAMFLVIGLLYERTHTRDIRDYGSLTRVAPRFAMFIALAFIASVGLPGMSGFIAELHVIIGSLQRFGWIAVVLSISMLVSAAYAIRTIGRLCTGPERESLHNITDMGRMETTAAGILALTILGFGIFPAQLLDLIHTATGAFSALFAQRL